MFYKYLEFTYCGQFNQLTMIVALFTISINMNMLAPREPEYGLGLITYNFWIDIFEYFRLLAFHIIMFAF